VSSEKIIVLLKLHQTADKQIKKTFLLLKDENYKKIKILLCEYVVSLSGLREMIELYAEAVVAGAKTRTSYKTIKSVIGICAEIEKEVSEYGISLEIH
tara:strand:- start:312 stop:605 length:294 start_codon:yes stop_codon:yes gene_type:complete